MLKNEPVKLYFRTLVVTILGIALFCDGFVPGQRIGALVFLPAPSLSTLHHDASIVTIEHKTQSLLHCLSFAGPTFEEVRRGSIFAITFLRLHFLGRTAAGLMLQYFLASQIFSSDL